MSLQVGESERVIPGRISTRELIDPIFMKTLYAGVIISLLFAYLGSTSALASCLAQSEWLVTKLAVIWPALPPQYELVLKVRGSGHAASFGFLCAILWTWPVICSVVFLWKHAERRSEVQPVSYKEIGQFLLVFPFAFILLWVDQTDVVNPLFAFHADKYGIFYLRQWFVFSLPALVLAIIAYAVGRMISNRFSGWRLVRP
jgi:hypothetical protein